MLRHSLRAPRPPRNSLFTTARDDNTIRNRVVPRASLPNYKLTSDCIQGRASLRRRKTLHPILRVLTIFVGRLSAR